MEQLLRDNTPQETQVTPTPPLPADSSTLPGVPADAPAPPPFTSFKEVSKPAPPPVKWLGASATQRTEAEASLRSYLSNVDDPANAQAMIESSEMIARQLGLSQDYVLRNYDALTSELTGISNNPQAVGEYVTNKWRTGWLSLDKADTYNELMDNLDNPEKRAILEQQLANINSQMPPVDLSEKSWLTRSLGGGAEMMPLIWETSKWTLAGSALMLATKGLAGKEQLATGLGILAQFVTYAGRAKSFEESLEFAGGTIFGDLMEMTDENGEGINEYTARTIAKWARLPYAGLETLSGELLMTGNNPVTKFVKELGEEKFKNLVQNAYATAMTTTTLKGGYRKAYKGLLRYGGAAVIEGTTNTLSEIAEEEGQLLIQGIANEMAKIITNEVDGTEFAPRTAEEWKTDFIETMQGTIEGMFFLQLPHMGRVAVQNYNQHANLASAKAHEERATAESETLQAVENASDDQFETLNQGVLAEEKRKGEETIDAIATPSEDGRSGRATATSRAGEESGSASYSISEDGSVLIQSLELRDDTDVETAGKIVEAIRSQTNGVVEFDKESPNASLIESALEMRIPELKTVNHNIGVVQRQIKNAEKLKAEAESDLAKAELALKDAKEKGNDTEVEQYENMILDLKEEINDHIMGLGSAEEELAAYRENKEALQRNPEKRNYQMTPEEYDSFVEGPKREATAFRSSPEGRKIVERLKNETGVQPAEAETLLDMMEARAKALGKDPKQWLQERFAKEDVFVDPEYAKKVLKDIHGRAGMRETDAGAEIAVGPNTDLSVLVHEFGHAFLKTLSPEMRKVAEAWAVKQAQKAVDWYEKNPTKDALFNKHLAEERRLLESRKAGEWTFFMKESFAEGFEHYMAEGVSPTPVMQNIFQRFAEFLKGKLDNIVKGLSLDDSMRQVYDSIFTEENLASLKETGEPMYAKSEFLAKPMSPEYEAVIKDAVENGYIVPDSVLENFSDTDWGEREITQRKNQEIFDWAAEMARTAGTLEEFMAAMAEDGKVTGQDKAWFKEFYDRANRVGKSIDINEGNAQWIEGLTDDYIDQVIIGISENLEAAVKARIPLSVVMQGKRYRKNKTINETQREVIRATFRNNPTEMHRLMGEYSGDKATLAEVNRQIELSRYEGIVDKHEKTEFTMRNRLALVDQLQDARVKDRVRNGTITVDQINDLFEKSEEALRKANEDLKNGIKRTKAEMRALQKDRDAKRKLKEQMRKIGKQIARPVGSTIALEQRKMIELYQNLVDPNFRRKSTIEKREYQRDSLLANPDMEVSREFLDRLNQRSLGEYTLEELQAIKAEVEALKEIGRAIRKAELAARQAEDYRHINGIVKSMMKDVDPEELEKEKKAQPDVKPTTKERALNLLLATFRPSRIADMVDGGAEYKGSMHKFFIDEVNEAYNQELRNKHARNEAMAAKLEELGLTMKDFERTLEVDGVKYSVDQALDIYAGYKNDLKRAAIQAESGNNVSEENLADLMKLLSEEEIALADWIIGEYSEHYGRLADAYRIHMNEEMIREKNYTPIQRTSWFQSNDDMRIAQELQHRNQFNRSGVDRTMTKKRVEMADENQSPLQLGLMAAWIDNVAMQEHYINMAEVVARGKRILSNKDVQAAARISGKVPHLKEMQKYIDRVANPNIYKSYQGWDSVVKQLRNNSAIAYLSFNLVTMTKQVPSLAFYMAHSSPGDIMKAIPEVIFNWKENRELIERLDPQMKERSIERYIEEIKSNHRSKYEKIIAKVGEVGLKGIMKADKLATTAGWMAVYNKNIRKGMSEAEAIKAARHATLTTQPTASAKDVASIYASDNLLSIFLQFTNQLNQIWNILGHDLPEAVKHKHYDQAVLMAAGLNMSAWMMWIIGNRELPDEPYDIFEIYTDQVFNVIPIWGKMLSASADGFDISVPVLKPVEGVGRAINLGQRALKGESISDDSIKRVIKEVGEGASIMVGSPWTALNRSLKAGDEAINEEYVNALMTLLIGGPWNDKQ